MKTHLTFSDNILQYLQDDEIIEFLSNREELKELYNEIKDTEMACVIPIVIVVNPVEFELDLNIIVKHEKADDYGQFEYYLATDFVNKETNILSLLNSLAISTYSNPDEIIDIIGEQVKELHLLTSCDDKPFLEINDNSVYFGLNKS
jgi:hypothetical protein